LIDKGKVAFSITQSYTVSINKICLAKARVGGSEESVSLSYNLTLHEKVMPIGVNNNGAVGCACGQVWTNQAKDPQFRKLVDQVAYLIG